MKSHTRASNREISVLNEEILQEDFFKENSLLNLLPVAVYACNTDGIITQYNEHAIKLWGRIPEPGEKLEQFFGAYQLYALQGTPLPYHQIPIVTCLTDGIPRKNLEIVIERPDQSRIIVKVNTVPIKNKKQVVTGAISCFYDITIQKQTERELERKRYELQDYVDNASIGLHWVDANGFIIWANKAELEMLGYAKEEYIGRHISEFHIHQHQIGDMLNRLSRNETLRKYETVMRCKDGSQKTVEVSSNVLWENDRFVHTRCFTVDVTAEKKLMQALKASETEYRQMMQGLPAAVYTTDANGYVTLYNEAAVELWGRAPEPGKDLWCGSWKIFRLDGSELPLDACPMAIALKEKRPVYGEEIIVERPDGTRRQVAPHPRPIFDLDGNLVGAVNMLVDITDIKRSEDLLRQTTDVLEKKVADRTRDLLQRNEELKKSEERYFRMIEEVEDYAIFMLNKEGIIQNWNRGAEKIKGYREDEILGRHFSVFYMPEDQAKDIPNKLLHEAEKHGKASSEGWRVRKNGTTLWASVLITALHDAQGHVIGFSKVTRDLTERKIAEDRIKQANIDLEFQNKELEQFAYAAAHDLKEPLRKIQFYSNYISETLGDELPERQKDYLVRSVKAASRMQGLIDDLLTYSKASTFTQQFEEVNLNGILDEVLALHHTTIEKTNAVIKKSPLPVIKGIPFQCAQLLDNLVGNALKYRHPHRTPVITISAEKVPGSSIGDNHAQKQKDFYKITIADNGIGFESGHADTIFNLFQRLHSSGDYTGSGIGLAICKRIVQNHKGFINAGGEPDKGATFNIYLPVG